jgi:ADP-ribose pyrophosphatase YjhB (NUDIX family)
VSAPEQPPVGRPAARVLFVDARDRILLFRGGDPARPGPAWWFTPGGGLDPGETSAEGAARELREETGYVAGDLGPVVFTETVEFGFDGVRYRQTQDFYLVRVPRWDVDTSGFSALERASVDTHRWWTLDELAHPTETVYPHGLHALLSRLLPTGTMTAC